MTAETSLSDRIPGFSDSDRSQPPPRSGAEEDIAMRPFTESLPMALLKAREAAMRVFRPLLAEHGLTEQQWRALRALAAAPADLEVGVLAEHTFLLSPSLSRILSTLEGRELVSRSTPTTTAADPSSA